MNDTRYHDFDWLDESDWWQERCRHCNLSYDTILDHEVVSYLGLFETDDEWDDEDEDEEDDEPPPSPPPHYHGALCPAVGAATKKKRK